MNRRLMQQMKEKRIFITNLNNITFYAAGSKHQANFEENVNMLISLPGTAKEDIPMRTMLFDTI